jgi:hypothetical protein
VTVFFKDEDKVFTNALSWVGISNDREVRTGVFFDDVKYTPDHRLAELTIDGLSLHVPTSNIALIVERKA